MALSIPPPTSDVGKVITGVLVAAVTSGVTFSVGYGSMSARVEMNSKAIEATITRREVEALVGYQRQSYSDIVSRLQQIEAKLDRMSSEKGSNR